MKYQVRFLEVVLTDTSLGDFSGGASSPGRENSHKLLAVQGAHIPSSIFT